MSHMWSGPTDWEVGQVWTRNRRRWLVVYVDEITHRANLMSLDLRTPENPVYMNGISLERFVRPNGWTLLQADSESMSLEAEADKIVASYLDESSDGAGTYEPMGHGCLDDGVEAESIYASTAQEKDEAGAAWQDAMPPSLASPTGEPLRASRAGSLAGSIFDPFGVPERLESNPGFVCHECGRAGARGQLSSRSPRGPLICPACAQHEAPMSAAPEHEAGHAIGERTRELTRERDAARAECDDVLLSRDEARAERDKARAKSETMYSRWCAQVNELREHCNLVEAKLANAYGDRDVARQQRDKLRDITAKAITESHAARHLPVIERCAQCTSCALTVNRGGMCMGGGHNAATGATDVDPHAEPPVWCPRRVRSLKRDPRNSGSETGAK